MQVSTQPETFTSLRCAAAQLGVPVNWLRQEADAGRVPCLRVGRRRLFSVPDLQRILLELTARTITEGDDVDT